jgi:hypothetical protein
MFAHNYNNIATTVEEKIKTKVVENILLKRMFDHKKQELPGG